MKTSKIVLAIMIALFLNFSSAIGAQTQLVDSLIKVLNTQKLTPDEQLELYDDIFINTLNSDIEKSLIYAEKGLVLAATEKNKGMISIFNARLGLVYAHKKKYDQAIIYFEKSLDWAITAKDEKREALVYDNMASAVYMPQGNWESALQYSMKALSIYEKLGDQKKCMVVFSNLASIHRSLHNNDRAIYYLEQAKEIAEKENNQYSLSHIAYDLGAICIDNKEFDQALEWELKAMEIGQSLGYKRMEVFAMLAIAEIYQEGFNDYNKAEKYATKAFSLAEEQNNPFSLLASRHILSKIYLKQKRYTASNAFASIVYEMDSTNIETAMAAVSNIVLSNIFLGNKTKSALFFEKYMNYVKQFNDESLHQSLSEMEVKYETEKKETRISQMEQERTYYLLLSVVGGILLLSLLVLFIILHRLAVHKRKLAEARIQQVAIQSVLDGETAERTRLARDLHDGLGGLLSVVKLNLIDEEHLDTARDLLDQSINEMRRVAHHLMPESLSRYGLKTSLEDFIRSVPNAHFYFFGEDKRLDKRKETLIYRCAHELVNNAIKYANASVINVQLVQETDRVSLTVQDNGCGFEIATIDGDGMGMNNLQDRVTAANGKINIYSSPGKGTEIDVELLLQ